MTKILPCYSLCPLIEQKSFLGVSLDADPDTVVVTTNSNIIGRYRVSDPKQISSWNSKRSISCSTVYDSFDGQYVTIFNNNEIRKWTSAEEKIDKVKKFKFSEKLFGLTISPENGKTLVIFDKGQVRYLNDAIENRKSLFTSSFIEGSEKICGFEIVSVANYLIVVLVVKVSKQSYKILGIAVDESKVIFNLPICRSRWKLCGHCIVADKNCSFISLWSDGKIYRDCLYPNATTVPSNNVASIDDLNFKQPIVMKALSSYNMAICGMKDDGLLLIMYSIKYNSIQCKQFYENCSNSPHLWNIHSNLFLIMGHNLVVVPFIQENRKLSTLIGSNHQFDLNDTSLLPESEVYSSCLPLLLEQNQDDKIRETLSSYRDIPDSVLLSVMKWSLKDIDSRRDILDTILNEYSSNLYDVSEIRSLYSVDESFFILERIMNDISDTEYNFKLLKWGSLFIDAFYQQYVMSDDKSILEKLNKYRSLLIKEENYMNEFVQLASVLSCVQRKKVILS